MSIFSKIKNAVSGVELHQKSLLSKRQSFAIGGINNQYQNSGISRSGGAKFYNALNPVSFDFYNRLELILRSRNLKFESTVYQSMIEWLSVYTIGTGLTPEPTPLFELIPNISDEEKQSIRKKIEARFSLIFKSKKIHVSEYYDYFELQRKIFESYITDGEVFVLFNYKHKESENDFVLSPVRLQIIPAECVRSSTAISGGTANGIKYDENGKITHYTFASSSLDTSTSKQMSYKFIEVPAETDEGQKRVVQISNRNQPNDLRGVPVCFNIFHELENVMTAVIAELDAQKNAAMIFGVIERDNPDVIKSNGFTSAANYRKRQADELNAPPVETRINTPGTVINSLNPGEKFSQLTTDRPNTNIPTFIYDILKPICASKGIPVEVLYGLFSSNYSASRAAIQQFWSAIKQYRANFVSSFLSEVYKSILTELVYAGEIELPGFLENQLIREAWLQHRYNGSAMPSLDPTRDYEAAEMAIDLGFATHEQMARELHASNYASNLEILSQEKNRRRELRVLKKDETK